MEEKLLTMVETFYNDGISNQEAIKVDHCNFYDLVKNETTSEIAQILFDKLETDSKELVSDMSSNGKIFGRWSKILRISGLMLEHPCSRIFKDPDDDPQFIERQVSVMLLLEDRCDDGSEHLYHFAAKKKKVEMDDAPLLLKFVVFFSILFSTYDYDGVLKSIRSEVELMKSQRAKNVCMKYLNDLKTDITSLKVLAEYLGKTIVLVTWDGNDYHTRGKLWLISGSNIVGGLFTHKRIPSTECSLNQIYKDVEVEYPRLVDDINRTKLFKALKMTYDDPEYQLRSHCNMVSETDGKSRATSSGFKEVDTFEAGVSTKLFDFKVKRETGFEATKTTITSDDSINMIATNKGQQIDIDEKSKKCCTIS